MFSDVLLSCALAKVDDIGTFAAQDVRAPLRAVTNQQYEIPTFAQHLNDFSDVKRGNILTKMGQTRRFRYRFNNPLMPPFVIMKGYADKKITAEVLKQVSDNQALF